MVNDKSINAPSLLQLPPLGTSATSRSSSHGGVIEVYENGFAFVDQVGLMRGYLSSSGIIGLFVVCFGLFVSFRMGAFDWLSLLLVFMLFVFLLFVQTDWIGYRYEPVLFDRGSGKVHIFKSLGLPWWQWGWNLIGRPKFEVQTFDWACVEGQVSTFTIFTGQVARRESSLVLSIKDGPNGLVEIQRVGVGPSFAYGDTVGPVERWEYVRRAMRGEGPIWAKGEVRYQDFGVSFSEALTLGQPLIGPGSAKNWRRGPLMWLLGAASLVFFPITAYLGMNRYISYCLKRRPVWPGSIKASIGAGPFNEATLASLEESLMLSGEKSKRKVKKS